LPRAEQLKNELGSRGLNVITISYDSLARMKTFAEFNRFTLPILVESIELTPNSAPGYKLDSAGAFARYVGVPGCNVYLLDSKRRVLYAGGFSEIAIREAFEKTVGGSQ
jgi:hypothetical protein